MSMSVSDNVDDEDGMAEGTPTLFEWLDDQGADDGGPRNPDPPEDPIVESTTVTDATVTIHAHLWQQRVSIATETLDVQIRVSSVSLNGISYEKPTRALTVENCRVTYDPRERHLEILQHS